MPINSLKLLASQSPHSQQSNTGFSKLDTILKESNPFNIPDNEFFTNRTLSQDPKRITLPDCNLFIKKNLQKGKHRKKRAQKDTIEVTKSHFNTSLSESDLHDFFSNYTHRLAEFKSVITEIKQGIRGQLPDSFIIPKKLDHKSYLKSDQARKNQFKLILTYLIAPILAHDETYQIASMPFLENKTKSSPKHISLIHFPKTGTSLSINVQQGNIGIRIARSNAQDKLRIILRVCQSTELSYIVLQQQQSQTLIFDQLFEHSEKQLFQLCKQLKSDPLFAFNFSCPWLNYIAGFKYLLFHPAEIGQGLRIPDIHIQFIRFLEELKKCCFQEEPPIDLIPGKIFLQLSNQIKYSTISLCFNDVLKEEEAAAISKGFVMILHKDIVLAEIQQLRPETIIPNQMGPLTRILSECQRKSVKVKYKIHTHDDTLNITVVFPINKKTEPIINIAEKSALKKKEIQSKDQSYLMLTLSTTPHRCCHCCT
ncbi:MAG: hypothetical protein CL521_00150 [Actinobacteria bacterium]|nr:hypothetical protein [Actinomycetota bacterium]